MIVLGPQASPPARAKKNHEQLAEPLDDTSWFFLTRAGEDACGPSTIVVDCFPLLLNLSAHRHYTCLSSRLCNTADTFSARQLSNVLLTESFSRGKGK